MLAVTGGKGGVGKTTVALGLAGALADRGADPLVVDADRDMPDLNRVAGTSHHPGVAAFADGVPLAAVGHTPRGLSGVRVVPLAPGVDLRTLRAALDRARTLDRRVLVDCPAGAGRDAALPLRLADRAVLVATPTVASLRDAAKAAAMTRALGAPAAGVVCTRTDDPPPVEDLLGCPLVGAVPESDAPLTAPAARAAYRSCVSTIESDPE